MTGERIDLDDLRAHLNPPFDPWMEDFEENDVSIPLLRSLHWSDLTEAADVHRDAERMVRQIHGGLLVIYKDSRPVKLGRTMNFDEHGKRMPIIFAAAGHTKLSGGRMRGRIQRNELAPPQESTLQRWSREADTNETLADLLTHLSASDNWYDLYKSMGLARRLGGGARALERRFGTDWSEWERVWRTANCYRHTPDQIKFPLPQSPPELEKARDIVLKILSCIL